MIPALVAAEFAPPSAYGAHSWPTTDGRTLFGRRVDETWWLWSPDVAVFRFRSTGAVEVDTDDPDAASLLWLRSALPLCLEARGHPVLHAGAVECEDGVVAFCGRTSTGKSTLAAACAAAGARAVADDALAFAKGDPVHALTLPFELRPRGGSEPPMTGAGGERLQLRSVLLLQPGLDVVGLEAVPPSQAFGALMKHAYCFAVEDSQTRLLRDYGDLVSKVRVARLSYPRTRHALPEMVNFVLAHA